VISYAQRRTIQPTRPSVTTCVSFPLNRFAPCFGYLSRQIRGTSSLPAAEAESAVITGGPRSKQQLLPAKLVLGVASMPLQPAKVLEGDLQRGGEVRRRRVDTSRSTSGARTTKSCKPASQLPSLSPPSAADQDPATGRGLYVRGQGFRHWHPQLPDNHDSDNEDINLLSFAAAASTATNIRSFFCTRGGIYLSFGSTRGAPAPAPAGKHRHRRRAAPSRRRRPASRQGTVEAGST
jgi:hypothetical protein